MFQTLRRYFYDRRRRIAAAVGIAGGIYLVGRYVLDRLEEMRERALQTKLARENLRRRFEQNQQDVSYMIMTLLPNLAEQILHEMDVEGLTRELQMKSRTARRRGSPDTAPSESSLASSVELLHGNETSSDVISLSDTSNMSATPQKEEGTSTRWTVDFEPSVPSQGPTLILPSEASVELGSPHSNANAYLSDSITSESVISASDGERPRIPRSFSNFSKLPGTRSKNELWREIKFLTFTRTMTIIYTTTLLSLLIHIQLNLLGRHKYVQSVIQMAREEKAREQREFTTTVSSLFWGSGGEVEQEPETIEIDALDENTEVKFLSLSWWLLHVGWKDVKERVRKSVEEVFESVSLKTKLDSVDLHRLMSDVRRKVEHETTYEGTERRTDFLSTLIPPTTETLQHVLIEAGVPPDVAASPDPTFLSLLEETRWIATSDYFTQLLGACLDKATDILIDGLRTTIFAEGSPSEEAREDQKVRLAGMLPGLARWSHTALNGLPNELVDGMADIREMAGLAAIIYTSYDNLIRD